MGINQPIPIIYHYGTQLIVNLFNVIVKYSQSQDTFMLMFTKQTTPKLSSPHVLLHTEELLVPEEILVTFHHWYCGYWPLGAIDQFFFRISVHVDGESSLSLIYLKYKPPTRSIFTKDRICEIVLLLIFCVCFYG